MTTTPDTPQPEQRPDEAAPDAAATAPLPPVTPESAGAAPAEVRSDAEAPTEVYPAPASPAPAGPAPAPADAPTAVYPPAGSSYPPTGPYGAPQYPASPYGGSGYLGHPYPTQPYPYGPRPIGGQQPYGGPAYQAQQPYPASYGFQPPAGAPPTAGTAPGAGAPPAPPSGPVPGVPGPDGRVPASGAVTAPPKRRTWLPVVATLVIVVLLGVAAIIASTHLRGSQSAAGPNSTPSSMASIGQSTSGAVPVSGSTAENPNWTAVAAAVQPSVVEIAVQTSSGEALGSGVVVDTSGHVVTNNHVVDGAEGGTVQVTLSDGRIYQAKVVGTDASTDLAVVQIQDPPSDLAVAQFGDSDQVKVGDPVMAVGNPLGLANTVTTGIVSAIDRPVTAREAGSTSTDDPVTNAIQIDAAINPGNSGGPLFDVQGRVIGITSSIATTSSDSGSIGLGFAIPVDLVKNITAQLIDSGTAQHAYLGVSLRDGTATADGVTRRGAQVIEVSDGSPAAAAGIKADDVVVAINDKPVGGSSSLAAYVRAMASGEKATLLVVRGGSTISVDVTLATRPDTSSQGSSSSGDEQQNQNGSSGSGEGNGELPGNLSPQDLWNWLQQQQQQEQQGQQGGSGQG
jgi:putative serine protease PepD